VVERFHPETIRQGRSETRLEDMSKESFIPSSSAASISAAAAGIPVHKNYGVKYICANCASKVNLTKGDPVRCKECGHRVLYKERTRRMGKCGVIHQVIFLAYM
jgi:DNA-directed RNA polymerase I, II, and III subunit RPABC4